MTNIPQEIKHTHDDLSCVIMGEPLRDNGVIRAIAYWCQGCGEELQVEYI